MRWPIRIAVVAVMWSAFALTANDALLACTAFCAAGAGQVLVGNNEDWNNPRTKIWFIPAKPGSYGRVYVGFDNLTPQGGMNDRGLWFDGFAAPPVKATSSSSLPPFNGNIIDKAMAQCGTVEEVVRLFSRYNRAFLAEAILMFADASGDAVSIEADAMVRKTGPHFVQTNFHQSRRQSSAQDERFTTASAMLEEAGGNISVDLIRRILAATRQTGGVPTLYSNIYELRSRTMHLYHFHDFDHVVTFRLDEELKKGEHVLDIPALFPPNAAAEAFAARLRETGGISSGAIATALLACLFTAIAVAVYGWIHAGRGFRVGLSVAAGTVGLFVALSVLALRLHHGTSARWMEFSLGPASGESMSMSDSMLRANGITVKTAVAIAYDVPPVRVIGPAWLNGTRYSLRAVVDLDNSSSFRSLLRQELERRLRLATHAEVRPFDVFVLSTTDAPRLGRAHGTNPSTSIQQRHAQLTAASMDTLASALQAILNKPVIDETGIAGTYNLELDWNEPRVESVTAMLRDRFGLHLSPGTRDLDALIVDRVHRDAALLLLGQVGPLIGGASPHVRQRIADILTIH